MKKIGRRILCAIASGIILYETITDSPADIDIAKYNNINDNTALSDDTALRIEQKEEYIKDKDLATEVEKHYRKLMKNPSYLRTVFSELSKYRDYINWGVIKTGIDSNLAYALFAVEAEGNLKAESRSRALVAAQFIRSTAKEMGLKVNKVIDERFHPVSLTKGVEYMDEINYFNDEFLIAAAYNMGPDAVRRVVEKYGNSWGVIKQHLPVETRWHVVKVMARKKILDEGFEFDELPLFSDSIRNSIPHQLKKGDTIYGLVRKYNVPLSAIERYNPQIIDLSKVLPGCVVYIPKKS